MKLLATVLVMAALLLPGHVFAGGGGDQLPMDPYLQNQCPRPKKPIDEKKLMAIVRKHAESAASARQIDQMSVDWSYKHCGWLAYVSFLPAGPGSHYSLIVSNAGKVKSVVPGM